MFNNKVIEMSQKRNKEKQTEKVEKKQLIDPKYKNIVYTGTFLVVVLLLFIINNTNGEPEKGPYPPNYDANPTEQLNLSDLKGKIVIVDFWATWCPPCRKSIPDLIDLKNEFGEDQLEIVGISIDEITRNTKAKVVPFIKEFGINFPIVYGDYNVVSAYGGVNSVPTSFVIDKEGKVVSRYVGLYPKSAYIEDINKILSDSYSNSDNMSAPEFSLPLANPVN